MAEDSSDLVDPTGGPDDAPVLLSDEPTIDLIIRAKAGDEAALDAVLQRCLPPLRRWAHGRLPAHARGDADTEDLVQQAVTNVLGRLERFVPTHVGAMQAYLRQSVINDIRSRLRVVSRRSVPMELSEEMASDDVGPLERAIAVDSYERYRAALLRLRPRDRELVVARVEAQWTVNEIAERFGFNTRNAAGMAVGRALRRLRAEMDSNL